jgi:hypothetical protein
MSDHDETGDASPEEEAQAKAFAAKVDDLVAGKTMSSKGPSLGDAEERELLRSSAIIRAAHHEVTMDAEQKASIIEEAMRSAIPSATAKPEADNKQGQVHSLDAARAKRRRAWSLGITGLVVAAAIALLWFRVSGREVDGKESVGAGPVATLTEIPTNQQSRPSDSLIGQIAPEQSGMATSRLDQIYGDRMGGYRALQYRRLAGSQ